MSKLFSGLINGLPYLYTQSCTGNFSRLKLVLIKLISLRMKTTAVLLPREVLTVGGGGGGVA